MNKALFLDRDGVIHTDVNYAYLPEQIEFIDSIFDTARKAHQDGYKIIIITNQSGIGRGYYTQEQFHALMQWMMERFSAESCPITAYYFCPHLLEAGCECRKPKPGMILQAAADHALDLASSMLIGDRQSDIEAGEAAGVGKNLLLSNAHGQNLL